MSGNSPGDEKVGGCFQTWMQVTVYLDSNCDITRIEQYDFISQIVCVVFKYTRYSSNPINYVLRSRRQVI